MLTNNIIVSLYYQYSLFRLLLTKLILLWLIQDVHEYIVNIAADVGSGGVPMTTVLSVTCTYLVQVHET